VTPTFLRHDFASHIANRFATECAGAGRSLGSHEAARFVAKPPPLGATAERQTLDVLGEETAGGRVRMDDRAVTIEHQKGVWCHLEDGAQECTWPVVAARTTHS